MVKIESQLGSVHDSCCRDLGIALLGLEVMKKCTVECTCMRLYHNVPVVLCEAGAATEALGEKQRSILFFFLSAS
jgi:hypothetical protein